MAEVTLALLVPPPTERTESTDPRRLIFRFSKEGGDDISRLNGTFLNVGVANFGLGGTGGPILLKAAGEDKSLLEPELGVDRPDKLQVDPSLLGIGIFEMKNGFGDSIVAGKLDTDNVDPSRRIIL